MWCCQDSIHISPPRAAHLIIPHIGGMGGGTWDGEGVMWPNSCLFRSHAACDGGGGIWTDWVALTAFILTPTMLLRVWVFFADYNPSQRRAILLVIPLITLG